MRDDRPPRILSPNRVAFVVTVDLDRSGYGTFSTIESAQECLLAILRSSVPHYRPQVERR